MGKKRKILEGHKKVGKKLIPPALQIPNITFTSFRDDSLPDLIWIAAFFLRSNDKVAVDSLMLFLESCKEILDDDSAPCLTFLSNFNKLNNDQKQLLVEGLNNKPILNHLMDKLKHQNYLFTDYPLKFLFGNSSQEHDKKRYIKQLEEDVISLLDRHSDIATKIQVTALVSMMATGKMFVFKEIILPDFNAIFTNPDSDDAKKAASFARATLNSGIGFNSQNEQTNMWPKSFWKQSFSLSGCR